jgi:hypothetical protein
MSVEEYLEQNISPEILQKANEFKMSSSYKAIKEHSLSNKYQTARTELKLRYKNIHENTLADIQRLQDSILVR